MHLLFLFIDLLQPTLIPFDSELMLLLPLSITNFLFHTTSLSLELLFTLELFYFYQSLTFYYYFPLVSLNHLLSLSMYYTSFNILYIQTTLHSCCLMLSQLIIQIITFLPCINQQTFYTKRLSFNKYQHNPLLFPTNQHYYTFSFIHLPIQYTYRTKIFIPDLKNFCQYILNYDWHIGPCNIHINSLYDQIIFLNFIISMLNY